MDRLPRCPLRVRSVPSVSPSGTVSLGSARLALFNRLIASRTGGTLVVRVAASDRERGLEAGLVRDLEWLGLTWDEGPGMVGTAAPTPAASPRIASTSRGCWCRALPTNARAPCGSGASGPHGDRRRRHGRRRLRARDNADFVLRTPAARRRTTSPSRSTMRPTRIDLVLRGDEHLEDTARQMLVAARARLRAAALRARRAGDARREVRRATRSPTSTTFGARAIFRRR